MLPASLQVPHPASSLLWSLSGELTKRLQPDAITYNVVINLFAQRVRCPGALEGRPPAASQQSVPQHGVGCVRLVRRGHHPRAVGAVPVHPAQSPGESMRHRSVPSGASSRLATVRVRTGSARLARGVRGQAGGQCRGGQGFPGLAQGGSRRGLLGGQNPP
jgi:hypothetical protein